MKHFKTCPICSKTFNVYKSDFERRTTCSTECALKHRNRTYIDLEPLVSAIAEQHGIEHFNQATTFKAIYPSKYNNRWNLAEDLGVSLNALNRHFDRLGVTR